MLRLSKITDYGVLILRNLAQAQGQLLSAREIANNLNIGLPVVSKVLKSLVAHQLVSSSRGSQGGYQLLVDPADISIAQVICALEGELAITECTQAHQGCSLHDQCALRPNWSVVNQLIHRVLANVSLSDMGSPIDADHVLERMLESCAS